jgi:membrane-associated phospholipid phosphatase
VGRLNTRLLAISFAAILAAVVLGACFLDRPVALFFYRFALAHESLRRYTENIPDLLGPAVLGLTAFAWTAYLWLALRGVRNRHAEFFRLSGTCIPVAFGVKAVLKALVGRSGVRPWLTGNAPYTFHWLHGGSGFEAFPSGHMTVFSALATALWLYYPRSRTLSVAGLALLALALIATDYHFVSDVLAGTYLGVLVCLAIDDAYGRMSARSRKTGEVG